MEWSGARWWWLWVGEWAGGCGCLWVCVRVVVVVCWVGGCVEMSVGMCAEEGRRTEREDVSRWEWVALSWWWVVGGGFGAVGGFVWFGSAALITRVALIAVLLHL